MPLFKKSHKEGDRAVDNPTAGPGPNFMGHNQPGANQPVVNQAMPNNQPVANNEPGSGYFPSQQLHPNQVDYAGGGHPDHHSKPSKFGGKVESAIGTMIGSDSLRAKGMQKEREARSLNMQSNELAQAESLEREAQMHRDRAMGRGGGTNFTNNNNNNTDPRLNY